MGLAGGSRTWWDIGARTGRAAAWLARLGVALALAAPAAAYAQSASALTLTSSRPGAATNQPITFTATVSGLDPAGPTPGGEVTFQDGAATLGTAALTDGAATFTVRSLAKGAHPIAADYAGDAAFLPSSGALPGGQVVPDSAPVAGSGQAVTFDGLTQDARVDDPTGALDGARTVELWFEAGPAGAAGPSCLVQQGEGDGLRFGLCLSAGRDQLIVRRGFETTFIPAAIGPGWHHLALAAGDPDTLIYLDDSTFSPLLSGLRDRTGPPLVVGGAPSGAGATDRFAGSVDELRLWSTTRTAAELETWARQPVPGDAPGLVGLWRMDEGAGASLFDAAPAHLEAVLSGGATWVPSRAWTRRVASSTHALAPFLAGYDPDGDPFRVTLVAPAQHGLATVDGSSISYLADDPFSGIDAFTCELAAGGLTSRFTTEVEVPPLAACQAQADCAADQACLDHVCVASGRLQTAGGGCGCSAPGEGAAPGASIALFLLALLALRPRRRRGAPVVPPLALLVGLALLGLPSPAPATEGFAVRTFEPAPAGDLFLAVPGASVSGHLVTAVALDVEWTQRPLVLQRDGVEVPDGALLQHQLGLHLGLSLALWERLELDLSLPFVARQAGQQPFDGVPPISGSAFEDPRLGARLVLRRGDRLSLSGGLALWLPLGDVAGYGSDGALRAEPALLASGRMGSIVYAGDVGVLIRRARTTLATEIGPALTGRAALAWRALDGRLQLGPELYGRAQLRGPKPVALEVLASVRLALSPRWSLAAAVGTRIGPDAPGTAPLRALVQLAWSSGAAVAPPKTPAEIVATPAPERPAVAGPEVSPPLPPPPAPPEPTTPPPVPPAPAAPPRVFVYVVPPPVPPPQAFLATPPAPAAVVAAALRDAAAAPHAPPAPAAQARPVARPAPSAAPVPPPAAKAAPAPRTAPAASRPVEVKITPTRIELPETIFFAIGTDWIDARSTPLLDAIAAALRSHPEIGRVVVEGHTDSAGRREDNLTLSRQRAEAVRAALVGRGIAARRLKAVGFGPDRPIGDNATAAGRNANRRVDFVIPEGRTP